MVGSRGAKTGIRRHLEIELLSLHEIGWLGVSPWAEELPRWTSASVGYIIQSLTDRFFFVRAGGNIEQALIGCHVLHDSRCLPVHRKHHAALTLFELFQEVAGLAAEGRQRLNVFGEIQHGRAAPVQSTLLGAARIRNPRKMGKTAVSTSRQTRTPRPFLYSQSDAPELYRTSEAIARALRWSYGNASLCQGYLHQSLL